MPSDLKSPTPLLMLGARAYSEVLLDMFECLSDQYSFDALVENQDRANCDTTVGDLPVIWHEDVASYLPTHKMVCALGTTLRNKWIEECEAMGFSFATLVHPSSVVSKRTALSDGVIIDAACVVAGYSTLGPHSRLGRRVSLGHHTKIGAYTTIHPGAVISGNCNIGSQVVLGSGTVVIDGVTIGDGAVTAAGTIVNKDIPPRVLAAGNPASIKREDYGPR
ncbi:Putative acetyltransferase EpsM [Thalassovita mediterranea]|jgi:sugar O-acyltransferase (sialic acid O-acetyltransferase NeuD family)|uniref:Putative acetyltransferase EpsM n=2 Tax=Thalassovita mediterranea TaxID=340021 RepID=A0A0P1GM28_9RHOB|nr:hypothetical protein [Thalassovita mediterranea]CUH83465.1 Putative acetyltransferase EpsM [Thalassovita mediterranea]SIS34964.1 sugar O-acyltransferase, sialic acid O-acetyltransferase NeuD family [Thalassovita mediterranea]